MFLLSHLAARTQPVRQRMASRLDLSTGNWLAGLFVLAIGVLLPILGIAKSFFFRSSAPKRSS